MNPALHIILARQRVAELIALADRGRHPGRRRDRARTGTTPFYRLPDGSWIYSRRDSS